MEKQIEKYLFSAIKISKPAAKGGEVKAGGGMDATTGENGGQPPSTSGDNGGQPPSTTVDNGGQPPSTTGDKGGQPPSTTGNDGGQPSTTGVEKPADQAPQPVTVPTEKPEGPEGVESPSAGTETSPMAAALRAIKGGLKPTTTVEKHLPIVPGSGGGKGGFDPSIHDEEEKKEFFDSEEELSRHVLTP